MKLYTFPRSSRGFKIKILLKLLSVPFEEIQLVKNVGNKTPEFLAINPIGKVPVLVTDEGTLIESNAIGRYLCRLHKKYYGKTFLEGGLIDDILDYCANEIEPVTKVLVGMNDGASYVKELFDNAKGDLKNALLVLENKLKDKTYFVDDKLSLADIGVLTDIFKPYTFCFDEEFVRNIPNIMKFMDVMLAIPEVQSCLGPLKVNEHPFIPPI